LRTTDVLLKKNPLLCRLSKATIQNKIYLLSSSFAILMIQKLKKVEILPEGIFKISKKNLSRIRKKTFY
jgi:hypothetical protein